VIDVGRWYPANVAVAGLTNVAGTDVVLVLAGGIGAVVAGRAVSSDTSMIKVRRHPGNRRMTIVTVVAAGNMVLVLARRNIAVVAG